jgi:hypothetical protein
MADPLTDPKRSSDMAQSILAIDPGPTESGVVLFDPHNSRIIFSDIADNATLKKDVSVLGKDNEPPLLAIEMIACYGMPVGKETFETCLWVGRFEEAFNPFNNSIRCYRKDIKLHLCGTTKAGDPNVRQALIDRLGNPGTKKSQGPTYGITKHMWAALAVAVYAADQARATGLGG